MPGITEGAVSKSKIPTIREQISASLVAQMIKNPPATRETWVWSLDWEGPLEEGMATHSSILAWRIPRGEDPGYSPWNSPGQNTGVGSLSLLQGTFPIQGSNPGLLYCRWILYQLNHKGSPRILEWVTYPFSRGSSQPRNRTRVYCIAGGFSTSWATS